jgi:RimJ/RimL family protein N-acetyltransferase
MLGPILEGTGVRLVPAGPEHLAAFVGWFAQPDITRYLLYRFPASLTQEEAWLERMAASRDDVVWAVCARDTGLHIGATGLHRISWRDRFAFNGIVIGERARWGRGHGTETIRLTTRFAFRELGLRKVVTEVYAGNDASRRIMEKIGFRPCGLLRRHRLIDGEWRDQWVGELFEEEWKDA